MPAKSEKADNCATAHFLLEKTYSIIKTFRRYQSNNKYESGNKNKDGTKSERGKDFIKNLCSIYYTIQKWFTTTAF